MEKGWVGYKSEEGKKVAAMETELFEQAEDGLDIQEAGPEIMKVFTEVLDMVYSFLDLHNIIIEHRNINDFNVYTTTTEINNAASIYYNNFDKIVINKSIINNKNKLIKSLVHEIYHAISINITNIEKYKTDQDFYIHHDESKNTHHIRSEKSGYSSWYLPMKEKEGELEIDMGKRLFLAFNEGITEILTIHTLIEAGFDNPKTGYFDEVEMIKNIILNTYYKEENSVELMQFIQQYFSGGMMHLRKIEKKYGDGALKILADLETESRYEMHHKNDPKKLEEILNYRKKVFKFFGTDDKEEREKLRVELLNKLEEL